MKCKHCLNEYDLSYFIPCPNSANRHEKCIYCMKKKYTTMVSFLQVMEKYKDVEVALSQISDENHLHVAEITCIQKELASIDELKAKLRQHFLLPDEEQRISGLLRIHFKCAVDNSCSSRSLALEQSDGSFIFQILHNHNCAGEKRNLNAFYSEIELFQQAMKKLRTHLQPQDLIKIDGLATDYKATSSVYKKLQSELHMLEDEAVKKVWGLPCRWRRERGQTNTVPTEEDIAKLKDIAKQNQLGDDVLDYIQQNFATSKESTYFQQRGYFIVLACSSIGHLYEIIKMRINVMCYAENLLINNMELLCNKKLKQTVLRNHIWMILFFIKAWSARKEGHSFPLMGKTKPLDSESQDVYCSL